MNDNLSATSPGGLPSGFSMTVQQQFSVAGFTFGQTQTINYSQTSAIVSLAVVNR
jgi:hypothetical protein